MHNSEMTIATCDVCSLVDGDDRQKPCMYCGKCQAYICESCIPKTLRRAGAMFLRKLKGIF